MGRKLRRLEGMLTLGRLTGQQRQGPWGCCQGRWVDTTSPAVLRHWANSSHQGLACPSIFLLMQQEGMDSGSRQATISNEPKQKGRTPPLQQLKNQGLLLGKVMAGKGFQQSDFWRTSTSWPPEITARKTWPVVTWWKAKGQMWPQVSVLPGSVS